MFVFITHLHLDHIYGLRHLRTTPVMVQQREWEKPYGDLPKLYPNWFAPELIVLKETYECFQEANYLTTAGDLIAIHTPGYMNEHISFLLKTDEATYYLQAIYVIISDKCWPIILQGLM